ncbi:uncharacterized protein LOC109513535 [Hippocampus comes]|uniref:uncharacterized protein LOC109513535 n=1 Tax=Hippocampus comes TaxID=109280 RepID=UPI00094EA829|nr:PREDICTED: uncharacterized protein LOC109513535 [Hippocampus comes]XP_019721612.1 PREDICTED: uncharacterized protein LOC109513535 [Hippocampus comes]
MLEQKKGLPLSSEEEDSSFRDSEEMNEVRDAQYPGLADKLPLRSDSLPCAIDQRMYQFPPRMCSRVSSAPNRVIYPRPLGVKENKDCVCAHKSEQAVGETKARCTGGLGVTSAELQTGLYAAGESVAEVKTGGCGAETGLKSPDLIKHEVFMTEKVKRWPTKLTPPD